MSWMTELGQKTKTSRKTPKQQQPTGNHKNTKYQNVS